MNPLFLSLRHYTSGSGVVAAPPPVRLRCRFNTSRRPRVLKARSCFQLILKVHTSVSLSTLCFCFGFFTNVNLLVFFNCSKAHFLFNKTFFFCQLFFSSEYQPLCGAPTIRETSCSSPRCHTCPWAPSGRSCCSRGKAVQVEQHISLTPRVESARVSTP